MTESRPHQVLQLFANGASSIVGWAIALGRRHADHLDREADPSRRALVLDRDKPPVVEGSALDDAIRAADRPDGRVDAAVAHTTLMA